MHPQIQGGGVLIVLVLLNEAVIVPKTPPHDLFGLQECHLIKVLYDLCYSTEDPMIEYLHPCHAVIFALSLTCDLGIHCLEKVSEHLVILSETLDPLSPGRLAGRLLFHPPTALVIYQLRECEGPHILRELLLVGGETLHQALGEEEVAAVDVEGEVPQLPQEGRVLILGDEIAQEGDHGELEDQRLPEVALGALVFEDFLYR